MEVTITKRNLAPGAFTLELEDQDKIIQIGFWEDGEIIVDDNPAEYTVITPDIEDWKRLRLIAGRAIKELESSES